MDRNASNDNNDNQNENEHDNGLNIDNNDNQNENEHENDLNIDDHDNQNENEHDNNLNIDDNDNDNQNENEHDNTLNIDDHDNQNENENEGDGLSQDSDSGKTLVIILSETRAHEITFNNFKKNVIDELNADLCLCIGIKPDYDYNNPFYKLAKYKFTYNEPNDFGDAFEYAYNIISKDIPKYEVLKDINSLHSKVREPKQSNNNITYYGNYNDKIDFNNFNDDEIIIHTENFSGNNFKNSIYGIKKSDNNNFVKQKNVITYKKPRHWREFLKIKDQFLGGIKDKHNQHPGSAGILIFFRWFLMKNLKDNDLINKYDRFVITRSDFLYQLPHPKINLLNEDNIWIPDGEGYEGYTDRHVILSKKNIDSYLNILNNMILKSNDYLIKMKDREAELYRRYKFRWNLERLIKFNLEQNNVNQLVKYFPYIMYSVRSKNGSTRWAAGKYDPKLGYCIKYPSEWKRSSAYKERFNKSGKNIKEFYEEYLK